MAKAYLLSEADHRALSRLLARERRRPSTARNRPHVPEQEIQTPDVYVARTPAAGIPASTEEPGTGTGSGTISVGSGYLRSVSCDIYRLITDEGFAELVEAGFEVDVYNLS